MAKKGFTPEQIISKLKLSEEYLTAQRYIVFRVEFDSLVFVSLMDSNHVRLHSSLKYCPPVPEAILTMATT
jgi:hypothetical protein